MISLLRAGLCCRQLLVVAVGDPILCQYRLLGTDQGVASAQWSLDRSLILILISIAGDGLVRLVCLIGVIHETASSRDQVTRTLLSLQSYLVVLCE